MPKRSRRRVRTVPHRDALLRRLSLVAILLAVAAGLLVGCASEREYTTLFRKEKAAEDRAAMAERTAAVPDAPLSLHRAVSLSLEHHLMAAVARREAEVEAELATAAKRKMLLEVRAHARRRRQNDLQASSSESLQTHRESLEPSISTEKLQTMSDLTLAWNVLDFGVSYLQWRQADSEARILNWQLARVRQNLVVDVTRAYCRAAVAQEAAERAAALSADADARIRKIQRLVREQSLNEVDALEHQKRLVQIQIRLGAFQRDLAEAKAELGELVGFPPGAAFRLVALDPEMGGDLPTGDLNAWEQEALWNRPELYQGDLRERIALADVRKSVLRMFPSVNFFARYETDSNRFLYRNHWNEIGVDTAWNILSLPQRWSERRAAEERVGLERDRRMAQAVGILAQMRLAFLLHKEAQETQRLAGRYAGIQDNMVKAVARRVEEGEATQDQLFAAEVDAFLGRVRRLRATSDLVTAGARFFNTLGRDPLLAGGWAPRVSKPLAEGLWQPPEDWDPADVSFHRSDRDAAPVADGTLPADQPGSPEAVLASALERLPGLEELRVTAAKILEPAFVFRAETAAAGDGALEIGMDGPATADPVAPVVRPAGDTGGEPTLDEFLQPVPDEPDPDAEAAAPAAGPDLPLSWSDESF
ncbi:MAG: TolC family protein [Planctomycetota bacterium]